MTRMIRKFFSLTCQEKMFLMQAWALLGLYRIRTRQQSFRRITSGFTHSKALQDLPQPTASQIERAERIGYLVRVAARFTPWQSLCLVQALVVQHYLALEGIPGQLVLGVASSTGEGAEGDDGLAAHAWLACGDTVVSGGRGHEQFHVASTFSWLGCFSTKN